MAVVIALLSCLLFLGQAAAAEPLTADDWKLEAAFVVVGLVDYGQTKDIRNHAGMRELNPLLGQHPSDTAVRNYFLAAGVSHVAITYLLPRQYRPAWQWGTLLLEVGFVAHNHSIGLRVNF